MLAVNALCFCIFGGIGLSSSFEEPPKENIAFFFFGCTG